MKAWWTIKKIRFIFKWYFKSTFCSWGKKQYNSNYKNTNEENKIEMKGVLSNIQDVDVADAFIKYKSAEMVYTASLQVTAKIFNNTILDYLR